MTDASWKNTTATATDPVRDPGPARGLLHAAPDMTGWSTHQRRPPPAALAPWVQHYWHVAWDRRGLSPWRAATLPHPTVHLVVRADAGGIHGVQTGRFETVLAGRGRVFGIKFRPGGFQPLLGASVATLAGRLRPVDSVFGDAGARYQAAVLACESMEACIALADAFLLALQPRREAQADLAGALVDRIADDHALLRVDQLTALSGLGLRALQRLFRHYVGASPKWVINRYRLHEAIEQLRAGRSVAWSELALRLGYFDQAHFSRDFRRLVGCTPAQFERDQANVAP